MSNKNKNENLEIAIKKYKDGNYAEVLEYLSKIIETNKNNSEVYLYLGLCKAKLNEDNEAIEYFDKAIKLENKGIFNFFLSQESKNLLDELYFKKALIYGEKRDYKRTIKSINECLKLNPNRSYVNGFKGNIMVHLGNKSKKELNSAIFYLKKALKLISSEPQEPIEEYYNGLGLAYFELENYNSAIEYFQKAVSLDPLGNYAHYVFLGKSYFCLEKYLEGIDYLSKAIELNNNDFGPYLTRGNCKLLLEIYNEALKDYDKAIELNNSNSYSYGNSGYCKLKLEKYEEAIKDYNKAIELDSNDYTYYYFRGRSKEKLEKYEEAIEDYKQSIKLDSEKRKTFYSYGNVGYCKLNLKQFEEAIKDFDRAIELSKDDSSNYSNRGHCKLNLEKYQAAVEDFNKAIELDKDDSYSYIQRGSCKGELKEYEEAIKDFDKAIELNENYLDAYVARGSCKAELKEYEEAIKDFDKAIELDLEQISPWYYYFRARCKKEILLYEEAIMDWEKAIKLAENTEDKIRFILNLQFCFEEINTLKVEQTLSLCNELLDSKPNNIWVSIYKANCLLFLKRNYELVIEIVLKIFEKDEKFADVRDTYDLITKAYLQLKNYPKAEEWARKYTEIKPNEANPFILLLWTYLERNEKEKAKEILEICNQKDPDWQKRREYKEVLEKLKN